MPLPEKQQLAVAMATPCTPPEGASYIYIYIQTRRAPLFQWHEELCRVCGVKCDSVLHCDNIVNYCRVTQNELS